MCGGQCRRQHVQAVPSAPLSARVPSGTSLKIASYQNVQQLQFELAGLTDLPFTISSWVNIGAGPDVINAFRAKSLDVANNAGIPPIQAHYQGYDAKIVAIDITRKPNYLFATKPGSDIHTVADFKGRATRFPSRPRPRQGVEQQAAAQPPGPQASPTSNQFFTALQSGQVDIAPLANSQAPAYLKQYESKGARAVTTDVVDLLNLLWAPTSVLADPAKAAAVAAYIPRWAQGQAWAYEHPDAWNEEFYVKTQNLTLAQARSITESARSRCSRRAGTRR